MRFEGTKTGTTGRVSGKRLPVGREREGEREKERKREREKDGGRKREGGRKKGRRRGSPLKSDLLH